MKPLCIYHGGCDDGFAAAWVVRQATGDLFEFYPGVYQKDPPEVAGRHVLMVDFSYKRPVIEEMVKTAASILMLDHHKTAQEDLADLPRPLVFSPTMGDGLDASYIEWISAIGLNHRTPRVAALFDMERCGATITWDYFFPGQPRPEFIRYIEDRDLWRRQLPNCDEFIAALRSYPQEFDAWDALAAAGPEPLVGEGTAILRYYMARVEDMKGCAHLASLAGHVCWVANAPDFSASEVAGDLAEREGGEFGACYHIAADGHWNYSLRSRGDFDVSEIARLFGGGGHRNAAGFSAPNAVHDKVELRRNLHTKHRHSSSRL